MTELKIVFENYNLQRVSNKTLEEAASFTTAFEDSGVSAVCILCGIPE